jgi:hypothetical protein
MLRQLTDSCRVLNQTRLACAFFESTVPRPCHARHTSLKEGRPIQLGLGQQKEYGNFKHGP